MAVTTTTTLSDLYSTHFSKKLLEHAVQELQKNQFALEADLPANLGSKVIRWFRPEVADAAEVQSITEGTVITNFRDVTYAYVEATLAQYGEAAKITDVVTMTGLFDALQQSINTMAEDCALHADTIIRNVLGAASTGLSRKYAQGLANYSAVHDATTANSKFVAADLLRACTTLKIARAPKIGGRYVAILPPQTTFDLMQDDDWLEASKYSNVQALYKGEVGMIYGVRVVEDTNPFTQHATEGTYDGAATGDIFSNFVLGAGAYGTPKLAGTQSPWKPKVMISDKPDKSDPLNQLMIAGWKAYWTAKVLNTAFGVQVLGKTTYA